MKTRATTRIVSACAMDTHLALRTTLMELTGLFVQSNRDEELRLEHRCRMGLLAVGILHWIVFYLLTQTGAPPVAGSGNITRARSFFAQHTVHSHGVDTLRSV